jgi:Sulfotransferase domain
MRVALFQMGISDVYHMINVFHNPDDAQWWMRAGDAKWNNKGTFTREDWDKLLGHCQVRRREIILFATC